MKLSEQYCSREIALKIYAHGIQNEKNDIFSIITTKGERVVQGFLGTPPESVQPVKLLSCAELIAMLLLDNEDGIVIWNSPDFVERMAESLLSRLKTKSICVKACNRILNDQ